MGMFRGWILSLLLLFIAITSAAQKKPRQWDLESLPQLVVSFSRTVNEGDDTRRQPGDDLIEDSVADFSHYFDERLLSAFWQEFRRISPRTDGETQYGTDHIIRYTQVEKSYGYIFKILYGDSFELKPQWTSVIRDTVHHTRSAQIIYKASSGKARGYIDLRFTIGADSSIMLKKLNFLPFDHSSNLTLARLSESDLHLINTQQSSILIDSACSYAGPEQVKLMKGLKKKLEGVKVPSDALFTSRLFIEKGEIWLLGVFDTDRPNSRLSITYKMVGKKFKTAFIEIIKKYS